jgi:flagellar basal body rod protein FlgG
MIYGLYLSAGGVVANSYRQDVIANNLANAETVGFKRDIPLFQQRLTESQQRRTAGRVASRSDPLLENLGGGIFAAPTLVDRSQGEMERTGSALDVAIQGDGYFAVADKNQGPGGRGAAGPGRLTRDGRLTVDTDGYLALANTTGHRVLDPEGNPIRLGGEGEIHIAQDGRVTRGGQPAGRIGVFDVPDRARLTKQGGTILAYPDAAAIKPTTATLHAEFVERANVDPTTELTALMQTQRQLEANANMIRYQDQTLQKLVNEVGKVG